MRRARGWGLENALENGDSAGVSQSVENISVLSTSSHHHPSLPSPLPPKKTTDVGSLQQQCSRQLSTFNNEELENREQRIVEI